MADILPHCLLSPVQLSGLKGKWPLVMWDVL